MRKPSEIIINGKTLAEILENHHHWLMEDVDGWEDMCAKLEGANLYCTDLSGTNLSGADLSGADLSGADLSGTNLSGADLRGADLRGASLWNVNFSYVNLCEANLNDADIVNDNFYYADFSDASLTNTYLVDSVLTNADFEYANLIWADFHNCNLCHANFRCCNLWNANFRCCNLWNANLVGAKDVPYISLRCPSDGAFIGWKRVKDVLIKLEIPVDAKRSSATTNKCRCDKAKVLGFYDSLGVNELDITELVNDKYEKCRYVKGEMVYSDFFDEDRWNECSHGIHFFVNKQDAINYGH